jgi:hypothetical protein
VVWESIARIQGVLELKDPVAAGMMGVRFRATPILASFIVGRKWLMSCLP